MTVTTKDLIPTGTTPQSYTCGVSAAILDKFTAYNPSTTLSTTLTVGIGSTLMQKILQPLETYTVPEVAGHTLSSGDTISLTGSAITVRVSGREVT